MTLNGWKKLSNKNKVKFFTETILHELLEAEAVQADSSQKAQLALGILDDIFHAYQKHLIDELEKREERMLQQNEIPAELYSQATQDLIAFIRGKDD